MLNVDFENALLLLVSPVEGATMVDVPPGDICTLWMGD